MENNLEVFTAHCYRQSPLLSRIEHKKIIIDSLQFHVQQSRIRLYGFVIMPTYIRIIWQKREGWEDRNVRQTFLKYTAQMMKHSLKSKHRKELEKYRSHRTDRIYQFWERNNPVTIVCTYEEAMSELALLHIAPCHPVLRPMPENYLYSSARFYITGQDKWDMLINLNSYFLPV